ncbi:MAG: hypothetical protein JXA96_13680 [Sedimentisphaerales bacterium]|nr:hypothetical protein [Sedimentisphaerales bacterium]
MRGFKGTVSLQIMKGTTPGDFLWTSYATPIIVSDKVLDIWKNFKKFTKYDVKIVGTEIPFQYHGIAVTGKGGPLDTRKSKARYRKFEGEKFIMGLHGFYFYEDRWDGSDIFYLDDCPGACIITEKVVKAMKKAKVTNCEYTPIEDVAFGRPAK